MPPNLTVRLTPSSDQNCTKCDANTSSVKLASIYHMNLPPPIQILIREWDLQAEIYSHGIAHLLLDKQDLVDMDSALCHVDTCVVTSGSVLVSQLWCRWPLDNFAQPHFVSLEIYLLMSMWWCHWVVGLWLYLQFLPIPSYTRLYVYRAKVTASVSRFRFLKLDIGRSLSCVQVFNIQFSITTGASWK